VQDFVFTVVLVTSLQLFLSILRQAVSVGDIYGIAKKPLSVSIAGDSGVGKDTLANALSECFGVNSTVIIPGDGYHRFERGDARWKATTHLNPDANDLWLWAKHLSQALARLNFSYRDYDHSNGRFRNKVPSNRGDLVISQGLHGLYSELSGMTDLGIYLSMDEKLRERLKMKRDTSARSSSVKSVKQSIKSRQSDFVRYVSPQQERADLRIHFVDLEENSFKILFNSKTPSIDDRISKLLQAIINLECRSVVIDGQVWKSISMKELGFYEMESLFRGSFDNYNQLFAYSNHFSGGIQGVLQYIVFMNLESKRRSTQSA
jgi:uridine kinase